MEIRYFNSWAHTTQFPMESLMMLAAELFADSVIMGGEPALALLFDKKKHTLNPTQKVNFIHATVQNGKFEEEVQLKLEALIDNYYAALKLGLPALSRDKKLFLEFKRIERIILNFYETIARNYEEIIINTTFANLRKLRESHTDQIHLEGLSRIGASNKTANPAKEAESILEFMFPRKTKRPASIVMLQPDVFLAYVNDRQKLIQQFEDLGNPEITMPEDLESYYQWFDETPDFIELWVFRIFDIPPINHLTHLELLRLKQDLEEPIAQYNETLSKWIECRSKSEKEKNELASTHVALVKSCISFNTLLSEHPLCKSLERGSTLIRVYTEICLFTIEMKKIWTYFEEHKIVHPDTVNALQTITANNPSYPSLIPVLGVIIKDDKSISENINNPINSADIIGRKKSIDLED